MKANPYINPVPTKDGQVLGYVHSLETFGAVDGPGIRFVAFMQGCNMRCKFCHNPDTWKKNVGTQMTASELLEKALPYRGFWGAYSMSCWNIPTFYWWTSSISTPMSINS